MPARAPRMTFALRPSPSLAVALLASHAGAAACLLWADVHPAAAAFGILALTLSLRAAWRRHVSLSAPCAAVSIQVLSDGRYAIDTRDGGRFTGAATPATVVHRWVVVLDLRDSERRCAAAVIARDMLRLDDHRRLRVALRTGATATGAHR